MNPRLRRTDRVRRQDVLGSTVLVIVTCAILSLLFLWINRGSQARGDDNCLAAGPVALNIIAIDVTDELSAVQRLALRNELVRILERVNVDEAVQIWKIAPSASDVPEAVGPLLCNPGRIANRWFQNPGRVEATFIEGFWTPLNDQLDELLEGSSSEASPIMESMQAMALRVFDNPDYPDINRQTLILASDMIQNTAAHSQLNGVQPFESFSQSSSYRGLRTDLLTDVQVKILYIQRPLQPTFGEHIEFWQDYFSSSGASLEEVVPVTGLSGGPTGG